jgi:hypothetical protein
VLINHPERPAAFNDVGAVVAGCAEHGLESIVCVDSVDLGRAALTFDPDCLLFENPVDIASDRALARPVRCQRSSTPTITGRSSRRSQSHSPRKRTGSTIASLPVTSNRARVVQA